MNIKGFIFDLDGTLLDSMKMWSEVDRKFLKNHGIEIPDGLSDRVKVLSFRESSRLFVEEFSLPMTTEEVMEEISRMVAEEYRLHIPLKPGSEEFLSILEEHKIPFCIATATHRSWAESALERLNLSSRIRFLLTCDEVGKGKESPEIFLQCAKRLGLLPEHIAVVEDSLHGILTAKSTGFYTIGIYDSASCGEKKAILENTELFIRDFYELAEKFPKLSGEGKNQ